MSEPYIPFYPADYLADTMHFSIEEHGAYLKLLFCMWRAGGSLPDDDKKICTILGIGIKKWHAIKPTIAPFFNYSDGAFSQSRLVQELKKAQGKRESCAVSGSEGGKRKALKNNNTGLANATNSLQRNPSEVLASRAVLRTSEPEPELLSKKTKAKKVSGYSDRLEEFWKVFPPNGASKSKTSEIYEQILKEGADHAAIIRSVTEYAAYLGRTGYSEAHATTWLRERRWENDYASLGKPTSLERGDSTGRAKPPSATDNALAGLREAVARRSGEQRMCGMEPATGGEQAAIPAPPSGGRGFAVEILPPTRSG